MAITHVFSALGGAATTTSFTITVPAAAAVDDLMIVEWAHRVTTAVDGTISDNSGDGQAWTVKGGVNFPATPVGRTVQAYKRVTAAMAGGGDVITVTGLTNSCAGQLNGYREVIATGDPFEAWTTEVNESADESHAAITTSTDLAWVALCAGASPSPVGNTFTSPLIERTDLVSTGGADSAISHGSYEKTPAGSSGALAWNWATNRGTGSIAYAITPAVGGAAPLPVVVMAPMVAP